MKSTVKLVIMIVAAVFLVPALLIAAVYLSILGIDRHHETIAETVIDPRAAQYIAQTYPGNDFEVSDAFHVFKDNCYRVRVTSASSRDTRFYVDFDDESFQLEYDSYERNVLSGGNTFNRIQEAYNGLITQTLQGLPGVHICRGEFCRYSETAGGTLYLSPNGLDGSTLELDRKYDVAAMGWNYGYITLTVLEEEGNINLEHAAEVLAELDRILTEAGVGYYAVDFTLASGAYPENHVEFHIYDVTWEDLNRGDSLARLKKIWDAQEAKRQELKAQWADKG